MKKRVVAYVTGSRAEFGIVSPLLRAFQVDPNYELTLYATGMHLMESHGRTVSLVAEEFPEVKQLSAVYSKNPRTSTVVFIADLLPHIIEAFTQKKPDFVLVHGDRAEMLAVAMVCLYLHIPVVHTQGGDISSTDDNTARHAISKLSQLHFPATKNAADYLRKLGTERKNIHVVGTLSLDTVLSVAQIEKETILEDLGLPSYEKFILVTQHPTSENVENSGHEMQVVMEAALTTELPVIVIYPNADAGSEAIITVIEEFSKKAELHIFKNIPYKKFIQLAKHATVWLGNSSACVVDAPALHVPVVLAGDRQKGRVYAENILNVPISKSSLTEALQKALFDEQFRKQVKACHNPWGDGHTVEKIMKILSQTHFDNEFLEKGVDAKK